MTHYSDGTLSCDFTHTVEDDIAVATYLSAHGLPEQAGRDSKGNVSESPKRTWLRTYCMLAAHSKNVSGANGWQPPSSPFDVTDAEIKANRLFFFRAFPSAEHTILLAWANALNDFLMGKKPVVPEEQRSTGNEAEDFLAPQASASTDDS